MSALEEGIARHRAVLAEGRHLLSGLAMRDVEVAGADLAVEVDVDETLTGPRGALQGGLLATLADIVAGRIAMQGSAEGELVVTSDLTVHYLAPVLTVAHAVGRVLKRGKRSVTIRVDVFDGRDGRLAAACTLAFMVVRVDG